MLDILALQTTSTNPTLIAIVYTVLLSFVLSTMIAITYEKTFRGLSYSRNYVQALVLSAIVAATVMQAIGDSYLKVYLPIVQKRKSTPGLIASANSSCTGGGATWNSTWCTIVARCLDCSPAGGPNRS